MTVMNAQVVLADVQVEDEKKSSVASTKLNRESVTRNSIKIYSEHFEVYF